MFNDTGDQPVAPTPSEIYQIALRILARRDYACKELQHTLQERGYSKEDIAPVLERLMEQGLVNDARFTEMFVRSRTNKGYGPIRIAAELAQRGITEELIEQQFDSIDWLEQARDVQQKKFGKKPAKNFSERAKEMRFLQYRGFTTEQIRKIYKE